MLLLFPLTDIHSSLIRLVPVTNRTLARNSKSECCYLDVRVDMHACGTARFPFWGLDVYVRLFSFGIECYHPISERILVTILRSRGISTVSLSTAVS